MAAETTRLLDATRALAPAIAAAADAIEAQRRLPQPLVDALVDAGLFRMLVPASLGGGEAGLLTFARVLETVATADGSTAWCLGQGAGSAAVAAFMDADGAREVFGDPRTILAWGPGSGSAVHVAGGYRLTGRWPFASGCHHATWLGGTARIYDEDGSPHLRDGAPETRRLLFPAAAAEIIDVWQVSGLRGTGSDDYAVKDLFVPAALSVGAFPSGLPRQDERREPGPLYAFPMGLVYAVGFASVAIGLARAVLDAFVDLAGRKPAYGTASLLREDGVVQTQTAQAEAVLRSARAFLHESVRDAWAEAPPEDSIGLERRMAIRLAATHAIHAAAAAVDTVYRAAGATAIFTSNPFERRFRDVHAVTQQVQGSQAHFKTVGQFFLGLEPESSLP